MGWHRAFGRGNRWLAAIDGSRRLETWQRPINRELKKLSGEAAAANPRLDAEEQHTDRWRYKPMALGGFSMGFPRRSRPARHPACIPLKGAHSVAAAPAY
jgi:hypothetical protein